jgi:hypothetical protein
MTKRFSCNLEYPVVGNQTSTVTLEASQNSEGNVMHCTETATLQSPGAPARFNSISEPRDSSIVLPELNSITEVCCSSDIEPSELDHPRDCS